ncbi:MAG: 2-oxoacid:acceptor oxidoreductase family protein [Candidatus Heimdallarchaeota archaeon]|nr:2-oxoacid:acceptor oxidoreductase family protein [Candidatus Heimdallarchaeota archaeon]MBY8994341.1 2-oxoacid:acceptor oxidoreductase family protein [Candidatus Heimdallarchaeota archaeon]
MNSKSKNCDINIMIRGIGGQGVKLAGTIIGQAAIIDGRSAVQSTKYGSAITGGETRSEIKVSTEKIIYPRITDIDVYVALTLDDLENYFESLIYITALEVAKEIPEPIKDKIILAPMIEIAEEAGSIKAMNMVLLGILNQLFNLASPEAFIGTIKYLTDERFNEINIKAFQKGLTLDLTKYNSKEVLSSADVCRIKEG